MVTVKRIPVPDPIALKKSAKMVNKPTHIPPKVAATGMIFLNWSLVPSLVNPFMNIPSDFNCLATSLGPCPETSIQVLLNKAQAKLLIKYLQR